MSGHDPLPTRTLDLCPACDSADFRPLPLVYEHRGHFPLAECRACGLRFLSVQPTAEGLRQLYDATYFQRDFRCGRSAAGYDCESAFRGENQSLLDQFERLGSKRRLLEVGCAAGWLLKHAEERGWKTQGVELSEPAAQQARSLGLYVFHGELREARLSDASFDLAYMGDVLEHVPDPKRVLDEVARVLAPGGHLYLRGPITTHSLARSLALSMGRTIVLREPPYHLLEFTPRSLRGMFERAGLRVVRLRQSKIAPSLGRDGKSGVLRVGMALLDAINWPLTTVLNVRGDRVVIVGRKG